MSIWATLSAIDCSDHIEQKGKFSYLAWTWAWAMVKEKYPLSHYKLLEDIVYPDGTMEVRVEVTVHQDAHFSLSHLMWLPVLDYNNRAIANPSAFDINTARMRCLVKCLAMFGLGHYIYAGESAPQSEPYTEDQKTALLEIMANKDAIGLRAFYQEVGQGTMDALFNCAPKGQKTRFKDDVRKLYGEANEQIKTTVAAIQEALKDSASGSIEEIYSDMTEAERGFVDAALSEIEKHQVGQLLGVVA